MTSFFHVHYFPSRLYGQRCMASRVQLQAPAYLVEALELADANDVLNVPSWEELNEQNKEEGVSPEKVEEGDT